MSRALLNTFALATLVLASSARAATFAVEPGRSGNSVTFHSKATMESFDGSTDRVSGQLTVDPDNLAGGIVAHIEVDLASLDTGIAQRNAHMRERHLETDRFPTATLDSVTVVSTSAPRLAPGQTVSLEIQGRLDLHGVKRPITAHVDATYGNDGAGETIHLVARFRVSLEDFAISRPKFLVLKLADVQDVTFDATAVAR